MKNFLIVAIIVIVSSLVVNAQSKDCCSKEKGETTKIEKTSETIKKMENGEEVEITTTTSTALASDEKLVEKEVVVNKVDNTEKCSEKSSCCEDKTKKKVQKEIEKKVVK